MSIYVPMMDVIAANLVKNMCNERMDKTLPSLSSPPPPRKSVLPLLPSPTRFHSFRKTCFQYTSIFYILFEMNFRPNFDQDGPQLGNQFEDDEFLKNTLRRLLPSPLYSNQVAPDLGWFPSSLSLSHLYITSHPPPPPQPPLRLPKNVSDGTWPHPSRT